MASDDPAAAEPGDWPDGPPGGTDVLVAELYSELRGIARREHYRAGSPMTLQTTALIGEAYLKLRRRDAWHDRTHFLACAATAMRHVLVDAARARLRGKRTQPDDWAATAVAGPASDLQIVKLNDALKQLTDVDPELARIVDCRFFAGYDDEETAAILGISDRTVRRKWTRARAWIHAEMAAD
ncbi:ECF-type sigma factor [Sphingomonas sp.]|uniref:ECF-type sigma factor n=1 Tax=Sphingomonas sp. TaxID=28214 RepID=UPI003CC67033